MSTRVAIIGAGVGGLATALALKHSGFEVTLLERDPEPPDIGRKPQVLHPPPRAEFLRSLETGERASE